MFLYLFPGKCSQQDYFRTVYQNHAISSQEQGQVCEGPAAQSNQIFLLFNRAEYQL